MPLSVTTWAGGADWSAPAFALRGSLILRKRMAFGLIRRCEPCTTNSEKAMSLGMGVGRLGIGRGDGTQLEKRINRVAQAVIGRVMSRSKVGV